MIYNFKGNIAIIQDWFSEEFTGGAEKVFNEIEKIIIQNNSYYEIFSLVNHLDKNQNYNSKSLSILHLFKICLSAKNIFINIYHFFLWQ